MRKLFVRSAVAVFCALVVGLPAAPVLAQQRSAKLTMVFLQLAPGGLERIYQPDAEEVFTKNEIAVLDFMADFKGIVSLAKVVEVTDVGLTGKDRRAVIFLTRWKADGAERSVGLPTEAGLIHVVALQTKEHGEVLESYPASLTGPEAPLHENGRWIHLSIDPRDDATVRYSIDRPGRPDLTGTAFIWRD